MTKTDGKMAATANTTEPEPSFEISVTAARISPFYIHTLGEAMDALQQFDRLLQAFDEPEEKKVLFALEKLRRSKKFILLPHLGCPYCPFHSHQKRELPIWIILVPSFVIFILPYFLEGSIQINPFYGILAIPALAVSFALHAILSMFLEVKSTSKAHQSIRAGQDVSLQLLHVAYGSTRVLQKDLWSGLDSIFPSLLKKVNEFLEKVGLHRERLREQEKPMDFSELNASVRRIRCLKMQLESESRHWETVFTDGDQFIQTLYRELSEKDADPARWDISLRDRFSRVLRFYRAMVMLEVPLKSAKALETADTHCFPSYNIIPAPFEIALQRVVEAFQSIRA